MSHIADLSAPTRPSRLAWMPPTFRVVGLVVTLATIASLEYAAGGAAGWSRWQSAGIPGAIDTFVLGTLLSPKARRGDRIFSLCLVETTVVISAAWGVHEQNANVLLGAVLATLLVAALWRQDETIRRERAHGDLLAEQTARAEAAEQWIGELEDRAATAERRVTEAEDVTAQATADAATWKVRAEAADERHREDREELDRLARRVEAAETRAAAAEARAAVADARRREDHDERPAPRTTRTTPSTTTDEDRKAVIKLVLAGGTHEPTGKTFEANPAAGRRTIADALRDCKLTPGGNAELSKLMEEVRAKLAEEGHHLAAVHTA